MRLDPKLVHPSLQAAAEIRRREIWTCGSEEEIRSAKPERGGSGWARVEIYAVVGIVLFMTLMIGLKTFVPDRHVRLVILFWTFVAALAAMGAAWRRQARVFTPEGLASLLPSLSLSETTQAYADTIVALDRAGRPTSEIEETMTALNALLDEEARLLGLRSRTIDISEALGNLDAERAALVRRQEEAVDPAAREAYRQSIVLLDDRRAGLQAAGANSERLEAHLTLLRQATFATRDAAERLAASSVSEPATDALRSAVALVRAQTTETEQALAELRSI